VTSGTDPRTSAASNHHRTEREAHSSAAERAVSKIVRQSTSHMLAGRAAGSPLTPCCGRTAHFAAVQVSRPPLRRSGEDGGHGLEELQSAVERPAGDHFGRWAEPSWPKRAKFPSTRHGCLPSPSIGIHQGRRQPTTTPTRSHAQGFSRPRPPTPTARSFGKVPPTRSRRRPDWRIPPRSGGAGL
jgi:hypothetical protein